MNLPEFLFLDPKAIANTENTFFRVTLAILAISHTLACIVVLLALSFKLLTWIFRRNK